jgi:thiamine kinase-like enzyme
MGETPEDIVRMLPCWSGGIKLAPLSGGVSNASFAVEDATGKYVARVGGDYPCHHVFRARELAASRAAYEAGFSPEVIHAEPGVMVIRFIDARTYTEADVRANAARCVDLLRRSHRGMANRVAGPGAFFWAFHILRDYARTLKERGHARAAEFPRWLGIVERLEAAQIPLPIVFGHHDLLPANFLDDGKRLWMIDWEYGGFGTAMFDLASLSSLNSFSRADEQAILEAYFDRAPDEALWKSFDAMKTAAALREAMWGMISELFLNAPGVDYVAYAAEYLGRFEATLARYEERYGRI